MSKVVFANGCFDLLTPAHFKLLVHCRKIAGLDGRVVVAIDSDGKIRQDKGAMRPIFSEYHRKQALYDLTYPTDTGTYGLVDEVFVFHTNEELYEIIKNTKPDFIVKGYQWKDKVIGSDLANVVLFPMHPKYSSTKTIEAVTNKFLTNIMARQEKQEPTTICECNADDSGYHSYDCHTGNKDR